MYDLYTTVQLRNKIVNLQQNMSPISEICNKIPFINIPEFWSAMMDQSPSPPSQCLKKI